ncbi:uncharacterized protein GGS22DRAFT_147577 [Annulohypoxylon maeteangense]|uniref:uncharacterized protein n=1 Tax=Annulohypoxylon maeteangense TaxID=1927788 RepID=UPI00200881D5|nr:uncharacterized protein GGS22DRAFT_147577 [Annulohypoxylon maeteangense]KAI0884852.1 hypothetical protein GGS22DRAFT_147577 [Annulohypoxylon maeteangense]
MRSLANLPTLPTLHGTTRNTTTASHVDSPHPTQTQVDGQVDQAIIPTEAGATRRLSVSSPKMLFSDLYKSTKSPLAKLRRHSQIAPTVPDYDPDLTSRDKTKQKDAIKRVLAAKVRNDWNFKWSRSCIRPNSKGGEIGPTVNAHQDDLIAEETDSGDDAASTYSTVSEDLAHFRPRSEWLSDMPDDDDDVPVSPSAYRFDNPDAVGVSVQTEALAKSAKRRRAIRCEMVWNDGLACFNARRDAWTGAKAARIRPRAPCPTVTSPTSKRLSWWHLSTSPLPSSPTDSTGAATPLSPSATRTSGDTTVVASSDVESKEAKTKEDSSTYPVETLIPIPQPILPAATPMRASITPTAYSTIYDKIVIQSATPSCPVNLNDVIRACVVGWKRDGEWPPRAAEAPPVVAVRRRKKESSTDSKPNASKRMSFSFLGRRQSVVGDPSNLAETTSHPETQVTGKAFKKGLQRVLGLGNDRTISNISNQ